MHGIDQDTIMVQNTLTQQYTKIPTIDFHPYTTCSDPTATTNMVFQARTKQRFTPPPPHTIMETTPAPKNHRQARKYPDAHLWAKAHDTELHKLDHMKAIHWLEPEKFPTIPNHSHSP